MNNKIWIISDTHFNHEFMKTIRSIHYQEKIIQWWKDVVWKNDTIIHLWDVIFDRPSELTNILKELPWYKILVRGNHDKNSLQWYINHWFDEAHNDYYIYHNRWIVYCTHKPTINSKANYNISWHLHNYKDNNSFRKKERLLLNRNSRVFSIEIDGYKPKLLNDILREDHSSAVYIRDNFWLLLYIQDKIYNFKLIIRIYILNYFIFMIHVLWTQKLIQSLLKK